MAEKLEKVIPIFTPTKTGAPSIVITYDKNSESYEQIMLGVFLQRIKSNNNTLDFEMLENYSDGIQTYEIKVKGT